MATPTLTDRGTGQHLVLVVKRILAPGIHTAPGFGVAWFAPAGTTRQTLGATTLRAWRFFVTPCKAFPLLRDSFTTPALRCDGRGLTVTAPDSHPPDMWEQRLGDVAAPVPIPWPLGSVGNPGPDYVPPKKGGKRPTAGDAQ
ncbi:MAG: hypothetical protein GEEBNDBF_02335 [bacterium]|nr:hypothetical protein [bacterium]